MNINYRSMTNHINDIDLIERYLLGKLTDDEIRVFHLRVVDDHEFARKFRLLKTFPEMMSAAARKELEQNQARVSSEQEKEKKSNRPGIRLYTAIIVGAAIILILSVLYFILPKKFRQPESFPRQEKEVTPAPKKIINPGLAVTTTPKDTIPVKVQQIPQPVEKKPADTYKVNFGGGIVLLNPADGITFQRKETLQFNWAMKTDTFTRFYIVLQGTDKVILWRGIRPGTQEYTLPGRYLYPGNYYWYVGAKDYKRSFTITE